MSPDRPRHHRDPTIASRLLWAGHTDSIKVKNRSKDDHCGTVEIKKKRLAMSKQVTKQVGKKVSIIFDIRYPTHDVVFSCFVPLPTSAATVPPAHWLQPLPSRRVTSRHVASCHVLHRPTSKAAINGIPVVVQLGIGLLQHHGPQLHILGKHPQ